MKTKQRITALMVTACALLFNGAVAQNSEHEKKVYKFKQIRVENGDTLHTEHEFFSHEEIPLELKERLQKVRERHPDAEGMARFKVLEHGQHSERRPFNIEELRRGFDEEKANETVVIKKHMSAKDFDAEIPAIKKFLEEHKDAELKIVIIKNQEKAGTVETGKAETALPGPGLKVFPNPASNELSIEYEAQHVPSTITLSDMQGKEVFSEQVMEKGLWTRKITLPENAAGMYLLNITSQGGNLSKKVMVGR